MKNQSSCYKNEIYIFHSNMITTFLMIFAFFMKKNQFFMSYSICKDQKDGDFMNFVKFSSNCQLVYGVQKLVKNRKILYYFWNLHTDYVIKKLQFLRKISKNGQKCYCKNKNIFFTENNNIFVFYIIDEKKNVLFSKNRE